ncbi:hypothetical protein VKT23_013893 [Stygiomarasmius scandens]|uniref:Dienelactone hydrolase domain-containing protein n=1 Tax=Marasmiellus scandens TaxID=2682957 RepID=A0ABR1J252_9AGAR
MTTPAVLAGPPGDCCFSKGVKHSGTPVGRRETIGGVPTYVSEPKSQSGTSTKTVILFMSDIWGPFGNNSMLIQDYFAENGFHVVGLDYFFGDTVDLHEHEPNFSRLEWGRSKRSGANEVVPKWFEAVKEIYGSDAKYCAVGATDDRENAL